MLSGKLLKKLQRVLDQGSMELAFITDKADQVVLCSAACDNFFPSMETNYKLRFFQTKNPIENTADYLLTEREFVVEGQIFVYRHIERKALRVVNPPNFDLWQENEELKKSLAQKRDFLAYLAHNLKGDLSFIVNNLRAQEATGVMDTSYRDMLVGANGMLRTLSQVVFLARGNRRMVIEKQVFYLGDLMKQVLDEYEWAMGRKKQNVVVKIKDKYKFFGDRELLSWLLHNLFENAHKYAPYGARIVVSFKQTRLVSVIQVEGGVLIPSERLRVLNDVKKRVKKKVGTESYGVGISIIKEVVGLHAGSLEVSSMKHLGTVFTISLKNPVLD